jgi:hypothetical protein
MKLDEILDAQTFYVSTDALHRIIEAGGVVNSKDKSIDVNTFEFNDSWKLVLHNNKLYLYGFADGGKFLESKINTIYNHEDDALLNGTGRAVIVPIEGVGLDEYYSNNGWAYLKIENIKPDIYSEHVQE